MSFWENVDAELKYSGKSRKELAHEVGFPDSYISKGIARKSVPTADLAVKIAHALNIAPEELLDLPKNKHQDDTQKQIMLYRKYASLITLLEAVPSEKQKTIQNAIEMLLSATM